MFEKLAHRELSRTELYRFLNSNADEKLGEVLGEVLGEQNSQDECEAKVSKEFEHYMFYLFM